jgi:hypothetical protein
MKLWKEHFSLASVLIALHAVHRSTGSACVSTTQQAATASTVHHCTMTGPGRQLMAEQGLLTSAEVSKEPTILKSLLCRVNLSVDCLLSLETQSEVVGDTHYNLHKHSSYHCPLWLQPVGTVHLQSCQQAWLVKNVLPICLDILWDLNTSLRIWHNTKWIATRTIEIYSVCSHIWDTEL